MHDMRILAVWAAATIDNALLMDEKTLGPVEELLNHSQDGSVKVLVSPTVEDIKLQLKTFAPTLVYLSAGYTASSHTDQAPYATLNSLILQNIAPTGRPAAIGPTALASIFTSSSVQAVFFNAAASEVNATALAVKANIPQTIYWPRSTTPHALVASHFARAFFATLRYPSVTLEEAFAVASHASQVHFQSLHGGTHFPPLLPRLYSASPPALPCPATVPPPSKPDLVGAQGVTVAGWHEVRLLAPSAELRVAVAGYSRLLDVPRVGHLAESLRALLALEARTLTVDSVEPAEQRPSHLPDNLAAVVCTCVSASGVPVKVLLGGPDQVLQDPALVQYALRLTLVTDVLSSQIKLPAPGQPPLEQRRAARGTPLVEVVLHTSIWGAAVLTAIAGDRQHRALVSMGVVGVAGAAVAAWTEPDVVWWDAVTSVAGSTMFAAPPDEGVPPVESLLADEDPLDGLMLDTYGTGRVGGSSREAFLLDYPRHRIVWESARPPLAQCSERLFYEDLVDFLEWYKGQEINRDAFPDTILNGRQLDLFNLYKEVVRRGGIRVGNLINWKGQIFERLRNYTESNKATAVGHALKKHYQAFLLEYEAAHPKDVAGDLCIICHRADAEQNDWLACDTCGRWSHYSCDMRSGLASYQDYKGGPGVEGPAADGMHGVEPAPEQPAAAQAAGDDGGLKYNCILCGAAEGLAVRHGVAPSLRAS